MKNTTFNTKPGGKLRIFYTSQTCKFSGSAELHRNANYPFTLQCNCLLKINSYKTQVVGNNINTYGQCGHFIIRIFFDYIQKYKFTYFKQIYMSTTLKTTKDYKMFYIYFDLVGLLLPTLKFNFIFNQTGVRDKLCKCMFS